MLQGCLRADGHKGIRHILVIAYLVFILTCKSFAPLGPTCLPV